MSKPPIPVTRPLLPPLEEFIPLLKEIWASHQLTNAGPMHEQLEAELARYLGLPYISLVANGTLALLTALEALDVSGNVITTPYTFVATAHALRIKGLRPVFVDVWASWCKNCLAMERTTFRAPEVVRALAPFTVVRLQAEDPAAFQKLKDFAGLGIKGFPAFVIFPHEP